MLFFSTCGLAHIEHVKVYRGPENNDVQKNKEQSDTSEA